MNAQPQGADFALALYDAACVSHQRKDWRQACHALAATLKAELLRSAATPMPANDLPAPAKPAAKAAKGPKAAAAPLAFTMTAESLSKALRLLCRITDRRGTIPILAHVLIVASGDTLDMTATDLDRELTLTVEAPGVGEWQATADAHALAKLLGKAKGPVSLAGEVTDHRRGAQNDESKPFCTRIMVGGAVNATLAGLPPADFPRVKADTLKGLHKVAVTPAQLVDGFSFARPAISTEETRYYLNGAYVHQVIEDGRRRVRIVATDGSRLAVSGHDLPRHAARHRAPQRRA
jgi:DNA polymerase-3 subunit beta